VCGGGWRGPDCAVPPVRLPGCPAACADTCARQCEPSAHARHDGAAPPLVESRPTPTAGGFLWRGDRSELWECTRACSAACVTRCEDDESEAVDEAGPAGEFLDGVGGYN
jgi:hypothetical protein